ncbi:MAG TPA: hypothetical protein VH251_08045 [Verrucomicrobiae bacterium]|nr:hypothetical protein [Verrucomicrobiae bacterium]
MKFFLRPTLWLVLLASCLFAGCASPARTTEMVAKKVPQAAATHEPVVVSVQGGDKTNPLWVSKISNENFSAALVESLKQTGLFKSVDTSGDDACRLTTTIEDLEQPIMGLDMTVSLRIDWLLVRTSDGQDLWHDKILSTYTATVGDNLDGALRLRVANEGAARQNIEQGLAKLAAVKF